MVACHVGTDVEQRQKLLLMSPRIFLEFGRVDGGIIQIESLVVYLFGIVKSVV